MIRIPTFLLRDTITIERYLGSGAYGETYDTAEIVRAHVEPTNQAVIDQAGKQARVEAIVMVRPEVRPIPIDSRITWGGVTFNVLRAGALPDEVRPTHRELMIG